MESQFIPYPWCECKMEWWDQLRLPIHSSLFSPACLPLACLFSVWPCPWFSWVTPISIFPVVFLDWCRDLVALSRFSTFFMGVCSCSFCFFSAVNSSKNMRRRLILDSPSIVFPWNDSKFRKTCLVFVAGSRPAYSGSSCRMNSSNSMSFSYMEV